MRVTATISTKDRYFSTLPLAMKSILDQTVLPDKFILFDDGDHRDLREVAPYNGLFRLLEEKKIKWEVVFAARRGQVVNHQLALDRADTDYIWRLDDDTCAEPDCLEQLLKVADKDPSIGAVGGLVLLPNEAKPRPSFVGGKIEDILLPFNVQWYKWSGVPEDVDHLYSTFLYRVAAGRKAGGYAKDLSPVCHREETTFTYQIKKAGYRVLVTPQALTWHFRDAQGGIRSHKNPEYWNHDEVLFHQRLKEWGVRLHDPLFVVLDNGLGDHIVFNHALPKIKKQHPGRKLVIAASFPEVFSGDSDVLLTSIGDAKTAFGDLDQWNIYKWCDERRWTQPLERAFEGMYQ